MTGKSPPSTRRRRGLLTDDDHAVWAHVTRDVEPLQQSGRRRRSVLDDSDNVHAIATGAGSANEPSPSKVPKTRVPRSTPSAPPSPPSIAKPAPALATFDRKRAKRLAAGRIAIEARLDLHGMRQADAHDSLVAFLNRAFANGYRTVLVITGKGVADDGRRDHDHDLDRGPRGVLKRNVPRWLAEPDLARLVVSYTEAHVRHGGGGALYIHLKAVRAKA